MTSVRHAGRSTDDGLSPSPFANPGSHPAVRSFLRAVAAAGICAAAGGWIGSRRDMGGAPLGAAVAALFLLLVPFFLLGVGDFAHRAARWLAGRPARVVAADA